jgi:hypothetical protein
VPPVAREQVIDLLKAAFVQDRLSKDEFDERVGRALTSRARAELVAVTADIPAGLAGPRPPRPPARRPGRIPMNTAVTGGACVAIAANVGMMVALFTGSGLALVLVGVFTVVGTILAIRAMVTAP